jgi:hypothetical protein
MMQRDLGNYFGIEVAWVKKIKKCLVLTAEDTSLFSYAGGEYWIEARDRILKMNKLPIVAMLEQMQCTTSWAYSPYPIIDETGYKGDISLEIEGNILDYKALDKALSEKYKMHLRLEDREVKVLVLTEMGLDKSQPSK